MKEKPSAKKGPPPLQPEERLDETVLVRLTATEKTLFSALAKEDRRSLSAWVRMACAEKARAQGENI